VNNRCDGGGGVIAVTGGSPIIRNNTIYGSIAPFGFQGAALYASGSQLTFERNLIAGSTGGTAVYCAGTNDPQIACNLLWHNVMGSFGGSCSDSTGASGNISVDPHFCSVGALDFGVCSDSPAATSACGPIGYASPTGNCAACGAVPVPQFVESMTWGSVKAGYR